MLVYNILFLELGKCSNNYRFPNEKLKFNNFKRVLIEFL